MSLQKKLLESIRSLLLAYLITILMLLILAFFVYQCNLGSKIVNLIIIGIYILTCFFGGLRLGKRIKEKRFLWGLLLGLLYILLLLAASGIVNHGIDFTSASNLSAIVLCIASGMLGGMVS